MHMVSMIFGSAVQVFAAKILNVLCELSGCMIEDENPLTKMGGMRGQA